MFKNVVSFNKTVILKKKLKHFLILENNKFSLLLWTNLKFYTFCFRKNPEFLLSKLKTTQTNKSRPSPRSVRQSYIGPVSSKPPPFRFKPHPVKEPVVRALINDKAPSKYPVVKPDGPWPAPKTAECFFWRTTGCTYKDKCFNLHIPEHKGIALKSSPLKH